MAVTNSIFPQTESSEKFQIFIDSRADKFNTAWYTKYFPMGIPQMSLSYVSVLGESTITSAATVKSPDGITPLRSRETLGKLYGEIPTMGVKTKINSTQYRDYMALQSMNVSDATKKEQAFKLIWKDVNYVAQAVDKRLDYLVAEGISTGKITITADNNPDGVVVDEIDLFMPDTNKKKSAINWGDSAKSLPLTDILKVVKSAEAEGLGFEKILMDTTLYQKFLVSKEVRDTVGTYFGLSAGARNSGTAPITQDRINEYLQACQLPIIEVVNIKIPIQKNGKDVMANPFSTKNAVFIPSGNLGEIKNAIAVEEERPVDKVVYAKQGSTLISKWFDNEPFAEYTKSELNAFPSFEAIAQVVLLDTTVDGGLI